MCTFNNGNIFIFKCSYATSFHNFISDHKSIVFRFGGLTNKLTSKALEKITFDADSHLKEKSAPETVFINTNVGKQKTIIQNSKTKFFN